MNLELLAERALGARDARLPRIAGDRHPQGAGQRFEDGLGNVVAVGAMMQDGVQVHQCVGGDGRPEFLNQFRVEVANLFGRKGHLPDKCHSTTQVDRSGDECFFHGQREVSIAVYAPFVTQGLLQTASKADPNVLDRVMLINVQVATGCDRQVEQTVPGEQCEHVIEKADTRGNL